MILIGFILGFLVCGALFFNRYKVYYRDHKRWSEYSKQAMQKQEDNVYKQFIQHQEASARV